MEQTEIRISTHFAQERFMGVNKGRFFTSKKLETMDDFLLLSIFITTFDALCSHQITPWPLGVKFPLITYTNCRVSEIQTPNKWLTLSWTIFINSEASKRFRTQLSFLIVICGLCCIVQIRFVLDLQYLNSKRLQVLFNEIQPPS